MGEAGPWGGVGGGASEVSQPHPLHLLFAPLIAFHFLLSHQVPEGLRFPIISLVMGEVVGTNFFLKIRLLGSWHIAAHSESRLPLSSFGRCVRLILLLLYHRR